MKNDDVLPRFQVCLASAEAFTASVLPRSQLFCFALCICLVKSIDITGSTRPTVSSILTESYRWIDGSGEV